MLVKVILLFLLAMAVIGMVGNLVFPGRFDPLAHLRRKSLAFRRKPPVCSRCGRYMIGTSGCECGKS